MRGVENAPPEDPDALALHVEERHNLQPPFLVAIGHALQARPAQLFMPAAECGRSEFRRQQRRRFRFAAQADEFGKETPLRKKLVLHDLQHGGGTLRRLESHVFRRELAPYAHYLAGFAGIGIEQMLEDRIGGAWHLRFRNRGIFVLHGHDCPLVRRSAKSYVCAASASCTGFTIAAATSPAKTNPMATVLM